MRFFLRGVAFAGRGTIPLETEIQVSSPEDARKQAEAEVNRMFLPSCVHRFRKQIAASLATPETIRRSKNDPNVLIFYRRVAHSKYLAAVVKTNRRNFILTVYLTERIQHQPL